MQGTSECPSAESLTLVMEGKASRRERNAWMSHIDGCADCRTVLAGAAAYVEDWRARAAGEKPPSWLEAFRASVTRLQGLVPTLAVVLAAALVIPVAFVYVSGRLGSGPAVSVAALTESLFTNGSTGYSNRLWRDDAAGAYFASALTEEQIAFRIGVYLVDLRVALREKNDEAARNSLHDLETLIPLNGPAAASASSLTSIRESVDSHDFPTALRGLDDVEGRLADNGDRLFVRFGEWAEASRLAAIAGRTGFFRAEVFRDPLEDIRAQAPSTPVLNRIQEIERLVAMDQGAIEFHSVEREFRGLILLY
jgi:hypothetical protein